MLIPNSCDLTSRSMKELIYLASKINVNFEKVFEEKDDLGNNILMELAKNMKDDALREVLTNSSTSNYVSILFSERYKQTQQEIFGNCKICFADHSYSPAFKKSKWPNFDDLD